MPTLQQNRPFLQVPTVQTRIVTMPTETKNSIQGTVLSLLHPEDGARQRMDNAVTAADFPGEDFYASVKPGVIECYSKTEIKGVRSHHVLSYDCRVTVPGRPCQFFVKSCSACTGFDRGGCRHANTVTAILNHVVTQEYFKSDSPARLVSAVLGERRCGCGEPKLTTVLHVPGRGYVVLALCVGIRGGAACAGGTVL